MYVALLHSAMCSEYFILKSHLFKILLKDLFKDSPRFTRSVHNAFNLILILHSCVYFYFMWFFQRFEIIISGKDFSALWKLNWIRRDLNDKWSA